MELALYLNEISLVPAETIDAARRKMKNFILTILAAIDGDM
jgi:hypothetical protein